MKDLGRLIIVASLTAGESCGDGASEPEASETLFEELSIPDSDACVANQGWLKSKRFEFPITLAGGVPAKIVGYLYYEGSFQGKTLLLAVHGGTYTHRYWDADQVNGHVYSFACYMARQRYAVLAVDTLGAGESSGEGTLDGDSIAVTDAAAAIGQVVSQLRQQHNPIGKRFDKIVLVGHSIGSAISLRLQADSHPADALVLTGYGHVPPPGGFPLDAATMALLTADPYVRLMGPGRTALFFGPTADPDMITYDAALLTDRFPRSLLGSVMSALYQPALTGAQQVTGKVLVQLSEHDGISPSSGASGEAAAFTRTHPTVHCLPKMGHCFNLHRENFYGWRLMAHWLHSQRLNK
jgi:pimeloyl-ACP methyl ester carboxylesterase